MIDKKSILGYAVGSPYRNNPYININTPQGLIDMSNTDIPLLAVDETGYSKVLPPFSGTHKFRGKKVKEIPLAKKGGIKKQKGGYSAEDLYNFLFEDDEEDVKPKQKEQQPTAPSEEELQQQYAAREKQLNDKENYLTALSVAMQDFDNPYTQSANYDFRKEKVGDFGKQIIGDISSGLGYTPQFNSVFRTPEKQQQLINQGFGVPNSWHLTGDAVDMKPSDWAKLPSSYQQMLRGKYDVVYHNNHYHVEPKGKRYQRGGNITGPIGFLNSYMTGDKFKERYTKMNGEGDYEFPKQWMGYQVNRYNPLVVESRPTGSQAFKNEITAQSQGYPNRSVVLDQSQAKKLNSSLYSEILPHEHSHNMRRLTKLEEGNFAHEEINPKAGELYEKFSNSVSDYKRNGYSEFLSKTPNNHDFQPDEQYSDLNALRYLMYKNGLYDTRKGDLDKKTFEKIKNNPNIKNSFIYQRLSKHFDDDSIIWLNNNIASIEQSNSNEAKYGGSMKKYQRGGTLPPSFYNNLYKPQSGDIQNHFADQLPRNINPETIEQARDKVFQGEKKRLASNGRVGTAPILDEVQKANMIAKKQAYWEDAGYNTDETGRPLGQKPLYNLGEKIAPIQKVAGDLTEGAMLLDGALGARALVTKGLHRQIVKNSPKLLNELESQVAEGNQWLKDWYSNPISQERYKNFMHTPLKRQVDDRDVMMAELSDYINSKKVGSININRSLKGPTAAKIGYQNMDDLLSGQDIVYPTTDKLTQNSLGVYYRNSKDAWVDIAHPEFKYGNFDIPNTTVHEGVHKLTNGEIGLTDNARKAFSKAFELDDPIVVSKYDKYLTNPTEIHARIGELRKTYGLKPETDVTSNMVNGIIEEGLDGKTSVDPRFFELLKDKKQFKWLMNNAPVAVPAIIGTAAISNKKKKGGKFNPYK
jgi:hypothetical protein